MQNLKQIGQFKNFRIDRKGRGVFYLFFFATLSKQNLEFMVKIERQIPRYVDLCFCTVLRKFSRS